MRIPVFPLPLSGTLAIYYFIVLGLTFFIYQIKLRASTCSVTIFYNSHMWYPDLTWLLNCRFSGVSPFLYIFLLAVTSNSNLLKLLNKLYLHNHSLCSLTRMPKFSIIQTWKSVILESSLTVSSTSNKLQNLFEFFICLSVAY